MVPLDCIFGANSEGGYSRVIGVESTGRWMGIYPLVVG